MPITAHQYEVRVPFATTVLRYMDKDKFESLLTDKALFFCRADKFSDPFEGSIPKREVVGRNNYRNHFEEEPSDEMKENFETSMRALASKHQDFKRGTVVNCWHINNFESDAMWRLYLKDNEGVAISTTVGHIHHSLSNTELSIGSSRIRYINYEVDGWYHPKEYPYDGYNLYMPLFHKRLEFIHEQEFRLYLMIEDAIEDNEYWNHQPNHKGMFIPVSIDALIQEVILAPTADEDVRRRTEELIKSYGYSFKVRQSALQSYPVY